MPRKTKKISIAKPEATKRHGCNAWIFGTFLGTLLVVGAVNWLCQPSIPDPLVCYQHREESQTVAQVRSLGAEFGKYTEVRYDVAEQPYFGKPTVESRVRAAFSFNELYKKMDSCDKFYMIGYRARLLEAEEQIEALRAALNKKHR